MSEHRLHPVAIVDRAIDVIRQFGIYGLIAIIGQLRAGGGTRALLMLGGAGLVVGVAAVLYWARFRYTVDESGLTVRGGVIKRFERTIPRARVQSVDTVAKIRHRAFGVVEVRVEVIGGGSTEGRLRAVPPAEAVRVRSILLSGAGDESSPNPPLVRLGAGDLFIAGLTGGRVAVLAVVLGTAGDFLPEDFLDPKRISESSSIPLGLAFFGVVLITLAVVLVVSLIMTILVYWDFTVRRDGDVLTIERGLLDRRRAVVPLRRIEQNFLRRPFGRAAVRVRIAGYGDGEEAERASMLLPIGSLRQAQHLVSGLLPIPMDVAGVELEPAPGRALRRRVVRAVVIGGAITAGTFVWLGPRGWVGALSFAVGGLIAVAAWQALGHHVDERSVVARSGVLVRTTAVVPIMNIQVCRIESTPFQRLAGLASMRLRVPRGGARALDLDEARARDRFEQVRARMLSPATAP